MICFTFSSTAMRASPRVFGDSKKRFGDFNNRSVPRAYHTGPRLGMTTTAPKILRMAPNLQVYREDPGV
jgi:hypothetical protein